MTPNAKKFATACYEHNTTDELIDALMQRTADKTDCNIWGIKPTEWREALGFALKRKINDLKEGL